VPKAVKSAVAPSTGNSVPVQTQPQRKPYKPMTGKSVNPVVARSDNQKPGDVPSQPGYGQPSGTGSYLVSGSQGSPSVPVVGFLFKRGPVDSHYTDSDQGVNPYSKVNNPPTRGMITFVKEYLNGVFASQDKTATGFHNRHSQQRTSFMRITPPALGIGYAPEIYQPGQRPQSDATYKYPPSTGTQPYGTGVLNSDTYGAGQTAGGIGGNNYSPLPQQPPVNSVTGGQNSGYPMWG
jgi:hypothetical protein